MQQSSRLMLAAAALALASTGVASAQSSPMPESSAMPMTTPAPAMSTPSSMSSPSSTMSSPMPMTTQAPPSGAKATTPPDTSGSGGVRTVSPPDNAAKNYKKIQSGSLTRSQVLYGLTHQVAAAKQLVKMKTINFSKLRVYKLPTSLQSLVKLSDADQQAIVMAMLGSGTLVAQTTPALPSSNGNNSPIQYLRDVLANINVSNALNNLNVLNGSNVNVNVALSNVLNNNKISIGQVVGLYIGGGGIITTITK
jgi:hypothetical protein